jgi:hypothetical protein
MAADPLDQVLRLVAEGRLSAEEAGPILTALDDRGAPQGVPKGAPPRSDAPGDDAFDPPADASRPGLDGFPEGRGASVLRIEVRDHGRRVVNLRLPIAVGRFALDSVPGLSGDQVDRVREALRSGATGSLLEVDDDGDGVRISLE